MTCAEMPVQGFSVGFMRLRRGQHHDYAVSLVADCLPVGPVLTPPPCRRVATARAHLDLIHQADTSGKAQPSVGEGVGG